MCTKPIKLFTNSKNFDMFGAKLYNVVPCGKCYQCQQARQEDWFVRCYFEWQQHTKSTFFYTLTFNPENLPTYYGFPCFDKAEVQKFFKRLRKNLAKYNRNFKYFIVCEFGELYKRPHHHILFFLTAPMNAIIFRKCVNDSWGKGFCVPGDNLGLVHSANGLRYVCKYITKDDSFTSLYEKKFCRFLLFHWYRKYLKVVESKERPPKGKLVFDTLDYPINNVPTFKVIWNNFYNSAYRDYLQKMPFHLQSTGIGISACDKIQFDTQDKLFLLGVGSRNIPRYIRRKLWMDRMPDLLNDGSMTKFALSSDGKKHELDIFDFKLENQKAKNAENISYLMSLSNKSSFVDILKLMKVEHIDDNVIKSFYRSIKTFFSNDENRDLLALYMFIYRNRCCPYAMDESFGSKTEFIRKKRKWYIRTLYDMSICNLGWCSRQRKTAVSECEDVIWLNDFAMTFKLPHDIILEDFLNFRLWNNHVIFEDCENMALFLDCAEIHRRTMESNEKKQKNDAVRRLRQKYKKHY